MGLLLGCSGLGYVYRAQLMLSIESNFYDEARDICVLVIIPIADGAIRIERQTYCNGVMFTLAGKASDMLERDQ